MTEFDLIQKITAGNTALYNQLVINNQQLVYAVVFRMVKSNADAEEITQDVFVKAFYALKSFSGNAKFSTWIYRIAYNSALTFLKNSKRYIAYDTAESVNYEPHDHENALNSMILSEKKAEISQILAKLPPDESAIIHWYYFDELGIEEIADISGNSVSNVKVKLYRIRQKIKTELTIKSALPI